MDFITATILSGAIYDLFKSGVTLGAIQLKNKLKDWLVSDEQSQNIISFLQESGINEDMGQHAIERKINENQPLLDFLKEIKPNKKITHITQQVGSGFNVVSDGGNVSIGHINISRGSHE